MKTTPIKSAANLLRVTAILGLVLLAPACKTQRANDLPQPGSAASLNIALKNTIDDIIIPAITGFKTEATSLQDTAATFCGAASPANLSALQAQWRQLSLQWNRIVIYNFGPLNDNLIFPKINFIESMRQNGTDYTNTVRGELAARLGDTTTLDPTYFDSLSFTKTGMLALEVLIFEDSNGTHSTDPADVLANYQSNSRKCEYLLGMSRLLVRHADYVEHGWDTEYLNTGKPFRDILLDGELEDGSEPVPALITAIQQHLDYVKKRKLEGILDAQIADYFYPRLLATLDAIETLLDGIDDHYSFFDHMNSSGYQDAVDTVRAGIAGARQFATNQDRSNLAAAVGSMDGNFKREIPDSLNVTLGINFSDGD